ncbi:hypothetical protein [Clostridium sp. UBA1652]|uniref:hypothetical protein n=1 Tax=Clostridium sp. UBA1652 TaxID=1946348 RepID=UPI00257B7698|nr:hypothetical protein [Clostridium sp. UBA1652]
MRKIIMLLTTICISATLFGACGGNKKEVKTTNDKPVVTDTKQENGLTKEEEVQAKEITETFAKSMFRCDFNTETEESVKEFTNFLTEEGKKGFDDNFVKTQLQEIKDKQQIVTIKSVNIDSITKEGTTITAIYTVNTYVDNSIEEEFNKKDDTTKCTLTLNKDFKIFKFENGI